ncbi:unnamed protein product [Rotaria sp. Silwood1]|nr:unnamed protein product [Rotaria sp. Silwood1]CAF4741603.1 unnamed protein product [Rotaria sp. Silwood1]
MSSTPASSAAAAPTPRVQSASNKPKEDSSKDGNNATTTVQSSSRPPSAIKQPATATTNETRPGSAAKNSSQDTTNRPASAVKVDSTVTPALDATTARPPSASQKQDGTTTNNTTIAPPGSRPPSAAKKTEDTVANTTTSVQPGSRQPSAVKKPEDTTTNTAATATPSSRPPSATNAATAPPGSRPPSANRKQEGAAENISTVGQPDTSAPIDPNDPNITKPIIGRPPLAAKNETSEESSATATLAASIPLNILPEGTPPSDNTNPVSAPAAQASAPARTVLFFLFGFLLISSLAAIIYIVFVITGKSSTQTQTLDITEDLQRIDTRDPLAPRFSDKFIIHSSIS